MIEAKNLRKKYSPKKGVEVHALDNVSVRLPDTGMVFVLGKSGSGKSTLLNVLGGLDTIDSGEIFIKGQSSKEFKQSHFDSYRNTYVGFIFQEYNILEEFTVGANIALAIELQGRKATNEEINSILAEVDLAGLGARKPNELSGGQKQRVAIARALVKNPEIIMADEPTGALDSNTGRQVFDTLKELSKKKLVLIVSHDREFSELYADRIIELADGRIISDVEYDKEATENAEEPNLSYVGKEITIKDGYELTDADRIAINEYIKKIKSNTSLIINDKRQNKIFKNTDENKIPQRTNKDFKLIKSRLSLKNAFKLGSSGLKYKKVRLVFTILLSFIAFALFGLADSVASYDSITTCTDSLMDSGIDYVSLQKQTKWIYDINEPDEFYWEEWDKYISKDEVAILEEQTNLKFMPVLGGNNMELKYTSEVANSTDSRYNWSMIYPERFSGISVLNENLISSFNYSLVPGSKLPENKNEIVIPKFVAEYYVKNGFLQPNEETGVSDIIQINSVADMIGKEITVQINWSVPTQKYKIAGILETGFDTSRYEVLADTRNEGNLLNMVIASELEAAKNYSLHAVMFVHQDLFENVSAILNQDRSNVKNGSFEMVKYKDKNAALGDNNYEGWPTYFYNLHKLSQINVSKVQWITDEPVTTLGKYDVIVPVSQIGMLLNKENHMFGGDEGKDERPDLSAIEFKTGIEAEYAQFNGNYTFESNQYILDAIAAYAYAKDHTDDAIAYIKTIDESFDEAWCSDWNEDEQKYVLNVKSLAYTFSNYATSNDCDLYDGKSFYDSLLEKYDLTDKLVTYEQYKSRSIKFPNGETYELFWGITKADYESSRMEILYANLAIETFYDAIEAAEKADTKPSWYSQYQQYDSEKDETVYVTNYYSSFSNYKNEYSNAINDSNYPSSLSADEIERAKSSYVEYAINELKNTPINLAIIYQSYGNNHTIEESMDARVVGITTESGVKIVVANEIYDALVDEISMGDYSYVVAPMPKDRAGVHEISKFSYENSHYDGMARFALRNSVTEELNMIDETLGILGQVFLYVGLGFALFASLMLSNFIATSISHKKQEIGILRAIGSRSNDVFMIFFAESFIISMINFVLALTATGVVVYIINDIFRNEIGLLITFLTFGIRQIGLLLGVSLLVAIIATFFPVKKIASMKPIDAIKNRK